MVFQGLIKSAENQDEVEWNKGLVDKINEVEVLCMVNKIQSRKAIKSEILPMKVWKVLGESVVK